MDKKRIRELAGIPYNSATEELDLMEREFQGRNLSIDTEQVSIEDIQRRLDAASRALGLANRIKNPEDKKLHLSRVMSNMNTIRSALYHMVKELESGQ